MGKEGVRELEWSGCLGEECHESRLDSEHVENTKVVSEYQEVIDQLLGRSDERGSCFDEGRACHG